MQVQVPIPTAARSNRSGVGTQLSYPPPEPLLRTTIAARFYAYSQRAGRERERRQGPRRSLHCSVRLIGLEDDSAKAIPAKCSDVGDGGLYAIVPIGYGVAIGNRYIFELTISEHGPEPGLGQRVSQQGEIVRVELLLSEDGYADRIGIGVRLCGPRCGLIPMPCTAH